MTSGRKQQKSILAWGFVRRDGSLDDHTCSTRDEAEGACDGDRIVRVRITRIAPAKRPGGAVGKRRIG